MSACLTSLAFVIIFTKIQLFGSFLLPNHTLIAGLSQLDADAFYRLLGKNIRSARGDAVTQAQLAKQIDMTRTSVTNIEKGTQRLQVHLLVRIAEALGTDFAKLLPSSSKQLGGNEVKVNSLPPSQQQFVLDGITQLDGGR